MMAPASLEVAYYHCVSRVVNREFVLGAAEKDHFVKLMRVYERLYGVRVVAYCIMSNHFHILVEVPQRPSDEALPDDERLVSLVRECLGDQQAMNLAWQLQHFREMGANAAAEELRESWFSRMWDVSKFMKVLKQRFTQWFNGRHKRRGTLWEDRFRSVLVQGECRALQTMAAYIDLNPVRAKICEDPKDYRWCGYAEAVAGEKLAAAAVKWLTELGIPKQTTEKQGKVLTGSKRGLDAHAKGQKTLETLRVWRCELFGVPATEGAQAEESAKGAAGVELGKRRISREKALEVLALGGRLPQAEYLRCRVRYFTDGAAIGTRDFVEQVFLECREWFSAKRKTGARLLRGLELAKKPDRLYSLRQLQKNVFVAPEGHSPS